MVLNQNTLQQVDRFVADPAQAISLVGPDGAGKGYLAKYLVETVLGKSNPYVRSFDATQIGIDDIREIQKFLTLVVPGHAQYRRAVIIEHVESLGHEAQNALLKTIEEPPVDSLIILTYTTPDSVLSTINSRTQHIRVLPITLEQALDQFDGTVERAYYISTGYVGLLATLLQSGADHPLQKAITSARELLGLSRYKRLAAVDSIAKDKDITPKHVLDALYRLLDATYHQAVSTKSRDDLQKIVRRQSLVQAAIDDLQANTSTKLVLSRLFFEL